MQKVYCVVSATEDEHVMETHVLADTEQEARDVWESDYKEGEFTHIMNVFEWDNYDEEAFV